MLVLYLALQPSASDLSVARAHPPIVSQGHIFRVELFQKLRKVVWQLRQRIVVRLESSGEKILSCQFIQFNQLMGAWRGHSFGMMAVTFVRY